MLEVDVEGEPITFVRLESCPLVTILHLHGLANAQELLRLILLVNAGGLNQEHERSGTTVHDRNLGGRQLDHADRKRVAQGTSVSVRIDPGCRRLIKKKNKK